MNIEDKNSIFELTLEDTSTRYVKNLNQASFSRSFIRIFAEAKASFNTNKAYEHHTLR